MPPAKTARRAGHGRTGGAAPGQEAGRPQPQTTTERGGGPFLRHTQPGNLPQYESPGNAFGQLVQQQIVARPGYYRDFRILVSAVSGANTGTTTASTEGQKAVFSLLQFKDPFGTLIFAVPSREVYFIDLLSGGAGCGLGAVADPAGFPSWVTMATGSTASGNFRIPMCLPLEFVKGIGTSPGANASLQPTLQLNLAATSAVYAGGGVPTTPPTLTVQVESDFYWLPEQSKIAPPSLGTTRQFILQQANPAIASSGSQRVSLPRLGGFLDTLILELLDSTGARVDNWPGYNASGTLVTPDSRMAVIIDGVPILDQPAWKWNDDFYIAYRGLPRPVGIMAVCRKTSVSQVSEGLCDTGEETLSTNPGTLVEVMGTPWGAITNAPAQLNVVVGQIVPRGRMVQGLPEV